MKRRTLLTVGGRLIRAWLFRDEFITAEGAPIATPHAAEPGPGSWTVVQTDGQMSIFSGDLVIPAQTTPVLGDLAAYSPTALPRSAGVAFGAGFKISLPGALSGVLGFAKSASALWDYGSAFLAQDNTFIPRMGAVSRALAGLTLTNGTYYPACVILRGAGAFYVFDNKLVWVDHVETGDVYPQISNFNQAYSVQYVRCARLGAPWNAAYGPGNAVEGVIAAATAFTHAADCLWYITATNVGSAGNTVFKFRKQDADNYWQLTIGSNGSLDLSEVVATVATSRGTAAAGTIVNGERIGVWAYQATISIFDATNRRINYASATNFQTSTSGELTSLATDAVYSNLEIYPITLSGKALAWVRAMEAA